MSAPSHITADQVEGFGVAMMKLVLSGHINEVADTIVQLCAAYPSGLIESVGPIQSQSSHQAVITSCGTQMDAARQSRCTKVAMSPKEHSAGFSPTSE